MKMLVNEILEKVNSASKKAEKIELLKTHNCLALRDVLKANFDETIEFLLPEGTPPHDSELSREGYAPSDLHRLTKMLKYLVKHGEGEKMKAAKREKIFIQLLEVIHPKDAKVVIAIKDKNLKSLYPGITKALVKEVWPKLIVK